MIYFIKISEVNLFGLLHLNYCYNNVQTLELNFITLLLHQQQNEHADLLFQRFCPKCASAGNHRSPSQQNSWNLNIITAIER